MKVRVGRAEVRRYRTLWGAERFARTLRKRFPHQIFDVRQHPYDFGWAIRVVSCNAWVSR